MSSGTVLSPKRVFFLSLALALGGFGIGSGEFVIMGLISRVATDLQVSPADVGYAISSYALGVVLGAPVISALSARLDGSVAVLTCGECAQEYRLSEFPRRSSAERRRH